MGGIGQARYDVCSIPIQCELNSISSLYRGYPIEDTNSLNNIIKFIVSNSLMLYNLLVHFYSFALFYKIKFIFRTNVNANKVGHF
jgi:hypothetical protein